MSFACSQCATMTEPEAARDGQDLPLHEPAMVPQVLRLLAPRPGDLVLDLTVGTAGHALTLGQQAGASGRLIGLDADPAALDVARRRLQSGCPCPFILAAERFSHARQALDRLGVEAADVALADLGVGTHQLARPERGFSFDSTDRLDMRYDPARGLSAWDVVNGASEAELADVFHRLGEERYSRQIAARICRERPIDTPAQLGDLVKSVAARRTPRRRTWRIHPATRVMMALRICVNGEMEELDALLAALPGLLKRGGRAAVLTYHSLEARRVKHAWREQERDGLLEVLTPSPLKPEPEEVRANPRVRSAQLRAGRRL